MTLLRDVIEIPERVTDGDFVIDLNRAMANPEEALRQYVVTPDLVGAFDRALGLVATAIRTSKSQATYLHGSFGSGKSHFMVVLHELLAHAPAARAIPELAPVIAKHDPDLQGTKVLPLTYHLIGADNLESAILGGYLRQIKAAHPDAPIPAVHSSDALFEMADADRSQEGDEVFFARLNNAVADRDAGAADGVGGWGLLGDRPATWDATTYEAARLASPLDPRHNALVADLVSRRYTAFTGTSDYLDLDTGLSVVSQHAKLLGYDAVVLFLDELILWFAAHLSNPEFVSAEGSKLAKLVEAQDADRPAPLVSFVSRQRDLAEFLGTHVSGAEKAALGDVFTLIQGRFETITLEDRDLPLIAERRLLQPKDESARVVLDDAFAKIDRRPEVWDVLLTGTQVDGSGAGSDQAAFRRTYPFSPALVATLVALSQALQRERTALKVMLRLLVEQRDTLEVTDLVPVGDLFDVLVTDDVQAVTPELKKRFDTANRLYKSKLRPRLLDLTGVTADEIEALPASHTFFTDDRLVKTLLLAALAPDVPALQSITASRLAALNHGTISTPIAGREASLVLAKVKQLAEHVAEVVVDTEGADPLLRVELSDVDVDSVVEKARMFDNEGNRRGLLRRMVWRQLGVTDTDTLDGVHSRALVWRGRKVVVDLVFGNVRDGAELPNAALMAAEDRWKVVVDYPFDAQGHTPSDDRSRVEGMRDQGIESRTVMWVPAFLSQQRLDDLGTLVVLDKLLGGAVDTFTSYADHLPPADREQARALLKQRRSLLAERLEEVLKQAFGVATAAGGDVALDTLLPDGPFLTLQPGLSLRAPVGATLNDAFAGLVDQALAFQWPDHPRFEPGDQEVKAGDLRKLLQVCEEAQGQPGHRAAVQQSDRSVVRRVANTLKVGEMHDTHLVLDDSTFPWSGTLLKAMAAGGFTEGYPVRELWSALDAPAPRGLSRDMAALIVQVFAIQQDLAWFRNGVAVDAPSLEQVSPEHELRQPRLATQAEWEVALVVAREVLGIEVADLRSAATLVRLARGSRERAADAGVAVRALDRLLAQHSDDLGLAGAASRRTSTAAACKTLLDAVVGAGDDDVAVVQALAGWEAPSTNAAARRSIESAASLVRALEADPLWSILRGLRTLNSDAARTLVDSVEAAASVDELTQELRPVLDRATNEGAALLAGPKPEPDPVHPVPGSVTGSAAFDAAGLEGGIASLRQVAEQHPDARFTVQWVADA